MPPARVYSWPSPEATMDGRLVRQRLPPATGTAVATVISRVAHTSCPIPIVTVVRTVKNWTHATTTVSTRSSDCLKRNTTRSEDTKANESEFVAFYIEPVQATGGYII